METKESVEDWNRNRAQPGAVKKPIAVAAQWLLTALDAHLNENDYCGLEVSKRDAPIITGAIENLRAALSEAP